MYFKIASFLAASLLLASSAFADLVVDVQAVSITNGTLSDSKTITDFSIGSVITFDVYASVTGTDGDPTNDRLKFLKGSFEETVGRVNGDMALGTIPSEWMGALANAGTLTVDNISGDVEIQSFLISSVTINVGNDVGTSPAKIYTFTYTVTSAVNAVTATQINFLINSTPVSASYYQDGVGKIGATGTIVSGAPVVIGVPEPSIYLMLGLGGLALAAVRRRK